VRIFIAFLFGVVFAGAPSYYFFSRKSHPPVLADVVEATPTLFPTSTPTPVPTLTPTPTNTPQPVRPSPTPTVIPVVLFTSQQINEFIDKFGAEYGVDPNILRHTALCESGFDPLAVNGSYVGLYQFGPITWGEYRVKMGKDPDIDLRSNAKEAVKTAAYAYFLEKESIWPNCVP